VIIIDKIVEMVVEIKDRRMIEKVDMFFEKCDRWAIPEGLTDMMKDMDTIKKQLMELNATSKELLKLKRRQLKVYDIKKKGGR
jgi:hypothetical protein